MKEKINKKVEEYIDSLVKMFIEDLRRVLNTGINSQELVRLFLEESIKVNISSMEKTNKKIRGNVFTRVNSILSEKGIYVKPIRKNEFNCRVSLIGDFSSKELWIRIKDGEIILEKRYLIESGKRAFEEITKRLVEDITDSAVLFGERAVKLRLGETVRLQDINILLSIKSETARRKIILVAVQKLKEVQIAAEFGKCKSNSEEGRYDCTIYMIDNAS
ncbi:MAG: hypothetical protein KAI71_05775 [Candidatus Pacebacteria bacterium]|nr:hypothetical protein [Candidatus Paceibacterota bacterium]